MINEHFTGMLHTKTRRTRTIIFCPECYKNLRSHSAARILLSFMFSSIRFLLYIKKKFICIFQIDIVLCYVWRIAHLSKSASFLIIYLLCFSFIIIFFIHRMFYIIIIIDGLYQMSQIFCFIYYVSYSAHNLSFLDSYKIILISLLL